LDRTVFFAAIRKSPFGGRIGPNQVAGCEAILAEWEKRELGDLRWLAYMLATTFHETAKTMRPITERGPVSYFNKYEPGTRTGKVLGNTIKGDGYRFRGRGYVQLTGRANYTRAAEELGSDFLAFPDKALLSTHAAAILFLRMTEGWFTGVKLATCFTGIKTDWRNARRIINGLDCADQIAGYARDFHAALQKADRRVAGPPPFAYAPKPDAAVTAVAQDPPADVADDIAPGPKPPPRPTDPGRRPDTKPQMPDPPIEAGFSWGGALIVVVIVAAILAFTIFK